MDAYDAALSAPEKAAGQIFNVGGGRSNTISVWTEFAPMLEKLLGKKIPVALGDWRPGDQPVFISDIRKAKQVLGWSPKVNAQEGIQRLFNWVVENRSLF